MLIHYHFEETTFDFNEQKHSTWLKKCYTKLDLEQPDITYIFCSDDYLLDINKQNLNHDYYTDIITFDNRLNSDQPLLADLFISIDRIKANAIEHKTQFEEELKNRERDLKSYEGFDAMRKKEQELIEKEKDLNEKEEEIREIIKNIAKL